MDDVLGRGWPFGLRLDADGALRLQGGPEKVRQAIWLVLATAPGERVMRPDFGCGIHELVFQADTAALRGQVHQRVHDALVRWEPRIDVLDVAVSSSSDVSAAAAHVLVIRVEYRLRAHNSVANLVYPLYLREGMGRSPSATASELRSAS